MEKVSVGSPAMFHALILIAWPRVLLSEKSSEQGMFLDLKKKWRSNQNDTTTLKGKEYMHTESITHLKKLKREFIISFSLNMQWIPAWNDHQHLEKLPTFKTSFFSAPQHLYERNF